MWQISGIVKLRETRKTAGTAESPARQQTTRCDTQINVKCHCYEIYICRILLFYHLIPE